MVRLYRQQTEFENDLFGRVVKKYEPYTYANNARIYTENTYDDAGNLTNSKTTLLNHLGVAIGNGFITANTQYQNSRVTSSSVSVNDTTQLTSTINEYDGYNRVLESRNPKINISKNQFALDGRLTLSKTGVGTPLEIHSKPDYNFINQPLATYTPYYGHAFSERKFLSFNIYDEFGRLKIVQDEFENSFQALPTPGEVETFKLYSQTGSGNRAINIYEGELLKKVEKWDVNDNLLQSSENFYDTHNRVIKTTVTTYTYVNGIQEVESALSSEVFFDIAGRVTKTINPYGAISVNKFDTIGRNIGSLTYKNQAALNNNQAEVETTLILDNAGLVEFSTIKEYNHATQLYEERTQAFEYDSLNRVTKTIDPNGYITQSFYNSLNQVEKVIDAEGNITRNEHDHLGNVVKAIQEYRDANGDYVKESTITNVYENGSELKQYIDDAGNITEYSYDIHSRLETTKLPGNDNLVYSQTYNALAQVLTATMPDNTVVTNEYNDFTQLLQTTITKGLAVSANYGADYYFYEYNPLKQLQQVTCKKGGASGTQISQLGYQYDSSGRVIAESQKHGSLPAKTIQSKFFDAQNKNQLVHPSGTVIEYRRNELGQLHQIAKNNVVVKENTFVGGKQARIQRGPLTQSLVYGNGNELLTSKYQNGNQTIVDYTLGYNKVYYKNFEKRNHESGIGDRYKYDSVYHLIETAYDAPLPEINANGYVKKEAVEYSNTDFRNSIIKFDSLGIIDQKFYQPNALHQAVEIDAVQGANGNNRAYNRNGNLTQNETGNLYEFDYANRLVRVLTNDSSNQPIEVIFTYDCTGRKIQKTVTQTNTNIVITDEHYYYSGEEVIAEYNASDVLLRSYVLGERLDIPVVVTEGLYDFYFVYDTHGSVIAITNANGIVEERYKYDAHGNFEILIDSQWVNNRYFYAARDWEVEIKLYHNRARFYDPQNGFFIQRDPLGYVDGSNPYVYTSGNSVNYSDPLGLADKGESDKAVEKIVEKYFEKYTSKQDKSFWLLFMAERGDIQIVDRKWYQSDSLDIGVDIGIDSKKVFYDVDEAAFELHKRLEGRYGTFLSKYASEKSLSGQVIKAVYDIKIAGGMNEEKANAEFLNIIASNMHKASEAQAFAQDYVRDGIINFSTGPALNLLSKGVKVSEIAIQLLKNSRKEKLILKEIESVNIKLPMGVCFIAGTKIKVQNGYKNIEEIKVGDRVKSTGVSNTETEVNLTNWKHLTLKMVNPTCETDILTIDILKPAEWILNNKCKVGGVIYFVLTEMGIDGFAEVENIKPILYLEEGEGRVVLSTVTHLNGFVYNIKFNDSTEELNPTDRHLLFNIERNEFARTSELRKGDKLKTYEGEVTIESISILNGIYQVFNFEVEFEHKYFVSNLDILSHNNEANPCSAPVSKLWSSTSRLSSVENAYGV